MTPVQILRFASPKPGKKLLVLGAVHGNEVCGEKAIRAIVPKFASGEIVPLAGSVTFVPCCNPLAFERGVRYVDHNLNRDLRPRENPKDYEDHLANILCPALMDCDFLLDLHSYHTYGPAFIFAGPEGEPEQSFRRCLGPTDEVCGWTEGYARILGNPDDTHSIGTTEYARSYGGVGITLECGHHQDPVSVDVAAAAIENALVYCGIMAPKAAQPSVFPLSLRVRLEAVYWRKDEGRLARAWHHFDPVSAGEPLAYRASGEIISAEKDGYVLLPKENCPIGDEWFYFGVLDKAEAG